MNWRKINNADNYEVSDTGMVRSLDNVKYKWNGSQFCYILYKGKLLKFKDIRGYKNVSIVYNDGKKKTKQVHRLVMETFLPNENQANLQVNHINGNKADNSLENLEWCTCIENNHHAIETGLTPHKEQDGELNKMAKLTNAEVEEIIHLFKTTLLSDSVIANIYNVSRKTINNIRNNTTWKHISRN